MNDQPLFEGGRLHHAGDDGLSLAFGVGEDPTTFGLAITDADDEVPVFFEANRGAERESDALLTGVDRHGDTFERSLFIGAAG